MSVFSPYPFSSQTVYRIDYPPKKLTRSEETVQNPSEGQINLLNTSAFPKKLPNRQSKIEQFRQKVWCLSPAARKYLYYPVDESTTNCNDDVALTTYMLDYSDGKKERRILGTTTGESDYSGIIGKTGTWIKDNKYHGDPSKRPKFEEEELKKAKEIMMDHF